MTGWLMDLLILIGVLAIVVIAGVFVFNSFKDQIPEPFRKILVIVLVVVAAVIAIMVLLQLRGGAKFSELAVPIVALLA